MASLLNMSGGSLLKKVLPYDAEIEYLESTGTQWIDTGVTACSPCICNAIIEYNTDIEANAGFGSYDYSKNDEYRRLYLFNVNNTPRTWAIGYGFYKSSYTYPAKNTRYEIYSILLKGEQKMYVNGSLVIEWNNNKDIQLTTNILLFRITTNVKCKLYSISFSCGSVSRDFIPVRVGNVGYMYDKVSGQLFGNAGTGAFILGNDI